MSRSLLVIGFFLCIVLIPLALIIFFLTRHGFYVNPNTTAVVTQLRSLNRLETASFTVEKVIDASSSTPDPSMQGAIKDLLFGDRILLIAHGEVIAGFDLTTLDEKSIQVSGRTINVTLPKPQILVTTLENDKTRVYDRKLGLLTKGDSNLESKVRLAGEQAIATAACQGNILQQATDNARKQLIALLKAVGFTTVVITIPLGSC